MKKYVLAASLAAIVVVAAMASAGIGIKNSGKMGDEFKHMFGHKKHRMMNKQMGLRMHRNLLNMDREEGVLQYSNGTFYVNDMPLYVGDSWWLNHTIRSDYDGDGNYETVWNELNGLIGNHVVVNGIFRNETLIVSHVNGMFLRIPVKAEFITINGTLEKINGSYYIDGYRLMVPNRMARSDYDGDSMLEKMHAELNGLVGKEVKVDGYVFNDKIKPLHINGIAI